MVDIEMDKEKLRKFSHAILDIKMDITPLEVYIALQIVSRFIEKSLNFTDENKKETKEFVNELFKEDYE
jgi:hypothetical protein